jgi:hypothetical protein
VQVSKRQLAVRTCHARFPLLASAQSKRLQRAYSAEFLQVSNVALVPLVSLLCSSRGADVNGTQVRLSTATASRRQILPATSARYHWRRLLAFGRSPCDAQILLRQSPAEIEHLLTSISRLRMNAERGTAQLQNMTSTRHTVSHTLF